MIVEVLGEVLMPPVFGVHHRLRRQRRSRKRPRLHPLAVRPLRTHDIRFRQRPLHRGNRRCHDPDRHPDDDRRRGRRILRLQGVGQLRCRPARRYLPQGAELLLPQHRPLQHRLAGHAADQRRHPAAELRQYAPAYGSARPRDADRRTDHGHFHGYKQGDAYVAGAGDCRAGSGNQHRHLHQNGGATLHRRAEPRGRAELQCAGKPDQRPRGQVLCPGGARDPAL